MTRARSESRHAPHSIGDTTTQPSICQPDPNSIPNAVGAITYPVVGRICAALRELGLPQPLIYDVLESGGEAIDHLSSPQSVAALTAAWMSQPAK